MIREFVTYLLTYLDTKIETFRLSSTNDAFLHLQFYF